MTPADEIKQAAAKLRALAEAAAAESGNPRWTSSRVFPDQHDSDASVVRAEGARPVFAVSQARYIRGPISDYAAAMDPMLGLALVDWLDQAADAFAGKPLPDGEPALAVARQINGGAP
ncbi:hypothetical protein [Streptomyces sp. NPDC004324]